MKAMEKLSSILILVICFNFPSAFGQRCEAGWGQFGQSCFLWVTEQKSWTEARQACQALEADLARIVGSATATWLKNAVDLSQEYWIGLSDREVEGQWTWVDGNVLEDDDYSNWSDDEPNDLNGEDCVSTVGSEGKWNDYVCTSEHFYLCERSRDTFVKCDTTDGWESVNDNCYRYEGDQMTWDDAEFYCSYHDARLIQVDNQEVQDYLEAVGRRTNFGDAASGMWIGLTDTISGQEGVYTWSDGQMYYDGYNYSNWAPGEPSNSYFSTTGNCVQSARGDVNPGKWSSAECTDEREFICQRGEGTCPEGWKISGGSCYQFNTQHATSWSDAKHLCEAQGTYLVTINNQVENNFLSSDFELLFQAGISDFWIGISDYGVDGTYEWVNGDTGINVQYRNWRSGSMPGDRPGEPDCGSMWTGDIEGKWDTSICNLFQAFICETKEGLPIVPLPPLNTVGSCDVGWQLHGDFCYYFDTFERNFADARANCESLGAQLASIRDQAEQDFFTGRSDIYRERLYVGYTDEAVEGQWVWIDGTQTNFTNWDPTEPNNAFNGENCCHLSSSQYSLGLWNDIRCTNTEFSVCKKEKTGSVIITVVPTVPLVYDPRCGQGWDWDETMQTCYKYVPDDFKTWYQAREECRKSGGDLLSIKSISEQTYINGRLVGSSSPYLWIGANDMNAEGGWEWSDGTPFAYLNWNPGQPDDYFGEDCTEILVDSGRWNDGPCDKQLGYICNKEGLLTTHFNVYHDQYLDQPSGVVLTNVYPDQCAVSCLQTTNCLSFDYRLVTLSCTLSQKNINLVGFLKQSHPADPYDYYELIANPPTEAPATTLAPGSRCQDGWEPYGNKCYLMVTEELTWSEAKSECRKLGGDLVSIGDTVENSFVLSKVQAECEVFHSDETPDEALYKWVNQPIYTTRVTFEVKADTDVQIGLSPQTQEQDPMYQIVIGGWGNTQSVIRRCGRCIEEVTVATPNYLDRNEWRGFWVSFTGGLIRVGKYGEDAFMEWQDPNPVAVVYVGYYTAYGSDGEFRICQTHSEDDRIWLGLNDLSAQMTFTWSDSSEVTYTKWAAGEPNNWNAFNEDCVSMYVEVDQVSKVGAWNDELCDNTYKAVCKRDKEVLPPTEAPIDDDSCDPNWSKYGDSCYRVSSGSSSWEDGEAQCVRWGSNLVTVTDEIEQAYLTSMLRLGESDQEWFWIGLNDKDAPGTYRWTSGFPVTYTNWGRNQPDDTGGHCVGMMTGASAGLWSDEPCSLSYPFICEKNLNGVPIIPIVTPVPTNPSDSGCTSGWTGYGFYCYKLHTQFRTWLEAETYCMNTSGNLASLHSSEEEVYLATNLANFDSSYNYWIGFHDRTLESGFEWSDGSVVSYTNWNDGEPNDWNGEDCTEMFYNSIDSGGGWNDLACDSTREFICQLPKNQPPQVTAFPTPTKSSQCGSEVDWLYFEGDCYYFSSAKDDERDGWADARTWCRQRNSELVSIHNHNQQDFITGMTRDTGLWSFWIGLREQGVSSSYEWSDGSLLDYIHWNNGEPNDANGEEQCAELLTQYGGVWNDLNCGDGLPFICKKTLSGGVVTRPPTSAPTGNCPAGWIQHGSKCYQFVDGKAERTNWTHARDICRRVDGGDLAAVHTQELQAFLTTQLRYASDEMWIGLSDTLTQGQFRWSDGSSLDYVRWAVGEPNGDGHEDCVEMYHLDHHAGEWNDLNCEQLRGYVCQLTIDDSLYPEVTDAPSPCYSDWVEEGGACWKVEPTQRNFADALAYCQSLDTGVTTTLASIMNAYDDAYVEMKVLETGASLWIGLQLDEKTGQYSWLDGWPVGYTDWGGNEPDGDGNCILVNASGTWQDQDCGAQAAAAICKYYLGERPTTVYPGEDWCPDGWAEYGADCYFAPAADALASWPEAQYECQKLGANLPSIPTQSENNFMRQLIQGLDNNCWLGLYRGDSGGFAWIDEKPVKYTYWAEGEPSTEHNDEQESCVEMYKTKGDWNDLNCYARIAYVCKKPKSYYTKPPQATTPSDTKPDATTWSGPINGTDKPGDTGKNTGGNGPLSSGALAGIIIMVLVVLVLLVVGGVFLYKRREAQSVNKGLADAHFDNALYSSSADSVKVDQALDTAYSRFDDQAQLSEI